MCDYNDVASLEAAAHAAGDDLAAIFAAPLKHDAFVEQAQPSEAYARRAREICDATGALLVMDDVRAGLRIARDCSLVGHRRHDLSTWGKCFANGHPISALLGSDKARKAAAKLLRHRLLLVRRRPHGRGPGRPQACARPTTSNASPPWARHRAPAFRTRRRPWPRPSPERPGDHAPLPLRRRSRPARGFCFGGEMLKRGVCPPGTTCSSARP